MPRHHPLAKCEECPLYESYSYVPSAGSQTATLAVVGEAPGKQEVVEGKPFFGPSGQIVERLLERMGRTREDTFLTNLTSCRGYDDKIPQAAVEACSDRLVGELQSLPLTDTILLGSPATKAFFGRQAVLGEMRVGPPKMNAYLPGVRVIPTYHTAACLRNPQYFPDVQTDFGKVGQPFVSDWKEPHAYILDDVEDVVEYFNSFTGKPVAIDIETAYEKDSSFVHPSEQEVICIGVATDGENVGIIPKHMFQDPEKLEIIKPHLKKFLELNNLICHNGKFDLAVLSQYANARLFFDTMLAAYALDERKMSYSLSNLAVEELGAPIWKDVVKEYGNFNDIPEDILYKYNAFDVCNTFRLFEKFHTDLEEDETLDLHDFLCRSSDTLMEMEMNGFAVDMDHQEMVDAELETLIEEATEELVQLTGNPKHNSNSWQKVKYALKEIFGVMYVPDTTVETIEKIRDKAAKDGDQKLYRFCEAHLKFKQNSKLRSTYVKTIRARLHDGKIHANFQLIRTTTGRLSCTQPNLQNVPRNKTIKNQYVPHNRENYLVQADYKAAELRALAYLAKDRYMQEVLSDPNRDMHSEVAERIFGSNFTDEQRLYAKRVVFGVNYGMEEFKLAAMLDVTRWEAAQYIETWFDMIPDVNRYYQGLEHKVSTEYVLQSPFGNKRRVDFVSDDNIGKIYKECRAFLPQNIASNINLEAANRVRDAGYGYTLRNIIHDAILFECAPDDKQTIADIKQIMEATGEEILEGFVPTPVEITKGYRWGELREHGVQLSLVKGMT